jgi:hypothetical protein
MSTQASFALLATSFLGRQVLVADRQSGNVSNFTITRLDEKLGTLKDGSKAEYLVLTSNDDSTVVITLHPQHAKRLLTKGSDSGLTLVGDVAPETSEVPAETVSTESAEVPAETATASEGEVAAEVLATSEQAEVQAELQAEQVSGDSTPAEPEVQTEVKAEVPAALTEVAAEPEVKAEVPAAPTKKQLSLAIFKEMTAAGKVRKDIIAAFKTQLGMSAACSNTYYQNMKSGTWDESER